MSIKDGYGKKPNAMVQSFINLPTITEKEFYGLHECSGEYIKAETFNSKPIEKDGEHYYEVYWRIFCGECFKEFKLLIGKFKLESKEVK